MGENSILLIKPRASILRLFYFYIFIFINGQSFSILKIYMFSLLLMMICFCKTVTDRAFHYQTSVEFLY